MKYKSYPTSQNTWEPTSSFNILISIHNIRKIKDQQKRAKVQQQPKNKKVWIRIDREFTVADDPQFSTKGLKGSYVRLLSLLN
jgi:hypothetical protein